MKEWDVGLTFLLTTASVMTKDTQLLNVSYDLTRGLYGQYNKAFSAHQKQQTDGSVVIRQSRGGSGEQAISVISGTETDVVTLTLAYDMGAVAECGWIDKEWIKRLPNNSAPCASTIIFLVHRGNPRWIHNWNDLIRPGISVITPNPKSSSGTRWNQLAAWGHVLHHNNNDQAKTQDFVRALYKNVEVLDSGARGSTNTFVERGIGDVLIAWGNRALLAASKLGKNKFGIITSSESIPAGLTVSVVNKVVEKKDTREVAGAYLKYLYSPEDQKIAAKNCYRPRDAKITKKCENTFPRLKLFTIDEEFDGWTGAQGEHFANGNTFDQISKR